MIFVELSISFFFSVFPFFLTQSCRIFF